MFLIPDSMYSNFEGSFSISFIKIYIVKHYLVYCISNGGFVMNILSYQYFITISLECFGNAK